MEPKNTETPSESWPDRTEPAWITRQMVEAIHADQLSQHGGDAGLRNADGLESALARPRNKWAYESDPDVAILAAAYGFGITKNHPFVDGNKRTGFMVMYTFLGLNGLEVDVSEPEAVLTMRSLASNRIDEEVLAAWIREHAIEI